MTESWEVVQLWKFFLEDKTCKNTLHNNCLPSLYLLGMFSQVIHPISILLSLNPTQKPVHERLKYIDCLGVQMFISGNLDEHRNINFAVKAVPLK